jgi:hypothetical protein
MTKIIEVTISPQGETTVLTKGYAGQDCLRASKFLEKALGVTTSDCRTPEYFQLVPAEQHQENQS